MERGRALGGASDDGIPSRGGLWAGHLVEQKASVGEVSGDGCSAEGEELEGERGVMLVAVYEDLGVDLSKPLHAVAALQESEDSFRF